MFKPRKVGSVTHKCGMGLGLSGLAQRAAEQGVEGHSLPGSPLRRPCCFPSLAAALAPGSPGSQNAAEISCFIWNLSQCPRSRASCGQWRHLGEVGSLPQPGLLGSSSARDPLLITLASELPISASFLISPTHLWADRNGLCLVCVPTPPSYPPGLFLVLKVKVACTHICLSTLALETTLWTSWVVLWLRICLPAQGTWD